MSGGAVVGDAFYRFTSNERATTLKDVEELVKAIGKGLFRPSTSLFLPLPLLHLGQNRIPIGANLVDDTLIADPYNSPDKKSFDALPNCDYHGCNFLKN